jgi:uridine kinase
MIIGLCGGTGSGKTTIARRIIENVGAENLILIEQDSYYRNLEDMPLDERHKANFDHPDSIDFQHLYEDLRGLKDGNAVEMPIYDFPTHTRKVETKHLEPKPVVLVEGILIFSAKKILNLLDVKVFVDTPNDVRFIRRLKRDIAERGRTLESVIEQYLTSVRPMHQKYVAPSKEFADIIISDGEHAEPVIELICGKIREELIRQSSAGVAK